MILITGHKGFIGSNLADHLSSEDEIYGIDAKDGDVFYQLSKVPWRQITQIYHQGAISDTTEKNVEKIYQHNIEFSISLFDFAIHHSIPVKYASSASIYGNTKGEYNPLNYYALSKLTVDMWVQDNIHRFKNIVGFRYFNVYGENEGKTDWTKSPVCKFTEQAKKDGVIKIFENSDKVYRDFVCVEDVINIITGEYESSIYDLGTSNPITFQNVAEVIAKKYNARIEKIPFPDILKDRYQFYTCARQDFRGYRYSTVKEYLNMN